MVQRVGAGHQPGNNAVSLLVVNGDRLYIGYDNGTEGVQIWRTVPETDDPAFMTDFEPVTPRWYE